MRRLAVVVAVLAIGFGGEESGVGEGGTGGSPRCYEYVLDPAAGVRATHCPDAISPFCWWTGRGATGAPERECGPDGAECGCLTPNDGATYYYCARVACWRSHIDNDPCCTSGPVTYGDGTTGEWDGERTADCS